MKKFIVRLIWGIGISLVLIFVFSGVLIWRSNPRISKVQEVQASPGPDCTVNDNLIVNNQLKVGDIVGRVNWLTLMPADNSHQVQVGYGGTPRDFVVWGNSTIKNDLTVDGKTNIVNPLKPWTTVDCTNFDAANETCNFTPDTNYSAVMIGIAADIESDSLEIGFFDGAGGSGNKIGELLMGSAVCEAAFGSFYRPAHSTVLLPTSVKSAKIISIGGCTRATTLTNNIIIMGYFK